MKRRMLRLSQLAIDLLALSAAFALAFFIRFDGVPPGPMLGRLVLTGPYVVAIEYLILAAFGVPRFSWRYVGLRESVRIGIAVAAGTALLLVARLAAGEAMEASVDYRHFVVPYGVLGVNLFLAVGGIGGVRIARRMLGEREDAVRRVSRSVPRRRTLLVGAGQAGVLVAQELRKRGDLGLLPVGFVDDDPTKVGMVIQGLPVLGDTAMLPVLAARHHAVEALITMASAPGTSIRRIRRLCEEAGVGVKIIPGLYEIVGGQVNLSRIRDVAIEDLLRRDPVALEEERIAAAVRGRVVLVTGAGGSIGSELCRQLCRFGPASVVLVEQAENALFQIHRELVAAHPGVPVVPCIADVTDAARVEELLAAHRPSVLLHAAAHKHVPMMEWNPVEAVKNNVFGTKTVADLAVAHRVEVFVMISTDKAVNPTSVMGATKRAAEVYLQSLAGRSSTRFVTVRFGNVLGSAGSVIPIFREQIERGGPVTVTHPDMRRYFMTIPEACQLVLQAGTMGEGGEIFILDMGEPVKVVDLARDLIALSGLREGEDIEIEFTGVRPGEKLFEELATDAEHAEKTRHPKIFVGRIAPRQAAEVSSGLEALAVLPADAGVARVRVALRRLVPELQEGGAAAVSASEPPPVGAPGLAPDLGRVPAS